MIFRAPIFLALPSAVTMALGNGVLCRVQHSAKWPKTTIFNFFYIPSWQINSYKHISHIYLIHHIYISFITYISHPSTHLSAHITSIMIYITYIIISAQVHQSPQVHHKYITSPSPSEQQMKKYNVHSSRPLRLWWRPSSIIRRCMRWIIRTTVRWRLHKEEKITCDTGLFG